MFSLRLDPTDLSSCLTFLSHLVCWPTPPSWNFFLFLGQHFSPSSLRLLPSTLLYRLLSMFWWLWSSAISFSYCTHSFLEPHLFLWLHSLFTCQWLPEVYLQLISLSCSQTHTYSCLRDISYICYRKLKFNRSKTNQSSFSNLIITTREWFHYSSNRPKPDKSFWSPTQVVHQVLQALPSYQFSDLFRYFHPCCHCLVKDFILPGPVNTKSIFTSY